MSEKSIGDLYWREYREYENKLIKRKELPEYKFFVLGVSDSVNTCYSFEYYDGESGYIYKNIKYEEKMYKIGIHHVVFREVFDNISQDELDDIFNSIYDISKYYSEQFGEILCLEKTVLEVLIVNYESKEHIYFLDKKDLQLELNVSKLVEENKLVNIKPNNLFISQNSFNIGSRNNIGLEKYIILKKNYYLN